MLGEIELKKVFPDFEDLVQPSGIDLELDEIFMQKSGGSLIDNEKNLPEIEALEGPIYTLKPHTAYLASIKRKVKIPKGYTMLYLPRSTLLRSFISVQTAVGDPGFYGTLMFMIYNHGDFEYKIKSGDNDVENKTETDSGHKIEKMSTNDDSVRSAVDFDHELSKYQPKKDQLLVLFLEDINHVIKHLLTLRFYYFQKHILIFPLDHILLKLILFLQYSAVYPYSLLKKIV